MTDQPQSSDDLVCPDAFPCKSWQINTDNISSGAESLRAMGRDVDARIDTISGHWQGLPAVYEAPEQESVYALMKPAATASEQIKNTFGKAADAIDSFATTISPVKADLASLEKEAQAFRLEALAGYDGKKWTEHQPAVDRNRELLQRYAKVVQTLTTAAADCANTIKGLVTGTCLAPAEAISAEAIMSSEEMMPWGAPVEKDRNCGESVLHGTGNFLKGTWEGAAALGGFGPDGWSLTNLKNTWVGVGDFVGSTASLTSPLPFLISEGAKLFGNDDVDAWVDRRRDVALTGLTGLTGFDYRAHQEGKDGWHKYKKDGVAAFTESALNIGSFFIPGAGAAGSAAKAGIAGTRVGSMVIKTVNAVGHVADFALPGGGWLVKGGAKLFNLGGDAVGALDNVVTAGGKAPSARLAPSPDLLNPSTPVSRAMDLTQTTPGRPQLPDVEAPRTGSPGLGDTGAPRAPEVTGSGSPGGPGRSTPGSPALVDDAAGSGRPRPAEPDVTEPGKARNPDHRPETTPEPETRRPERDTETPRDKAPLPDEPGAPQGDDGSPGKHPGNEPDTPTRDDPEVSGNRDGADESPQPERTRDADGARPEVEEPTVREVEGVGPERGPRPEVGEVPEGKPTHDPGGRPYEYDSNGRAHLEGDPEGTYRSESDGRLHEDQGSRYATDPNRPDIDGVEQAERLDSRTVDMNTDVRVPGWDDTGTTFAEDVAARKDIQVQHTQDLHARNKLAEELGIDTKDLTKSKVQDTLDEAVGQGKVSLEQAEALRDLTRSEGRSADALRLASERLGERAADTQLALNGQQPLFEAVGRPGSGRLDRVGIGGEPPSITVYEAKGGGGSLSSRTVDGIECQQGSTGYLNELARLDERYLAGLRDYLSKANPGDPVASAIREGTIEIKYMLVHAKPNGTVVTTPFKLDPTRLNLPKP